MHRKRMMAAIISFEYLFVYPHHYSLSFSFFHNNPFHFIFKCHSSNYFYLFTVIHIQSIYFHLLYPIHQYYFIHFIFLFLLHSSLSDYFLEINQICLFFILYDLKILFNHFQIAYIIINLLIPSLL